MMELEESDLVLCDKEMLELQSYVEYTMIFRILVYVVNTLVKYFLDKDKNVGCLTCRK